MRLNIYSTVSIKKSFHFSAIQLKPIYMNWLFVLVGGGLGSLSRWLIFQGWFRLFPQFPPFWATLVVNILGCFAIGCLFSYSITQASSNDFKLFCRIDKILWKNWDPIGLFEYGCRDEYYYYIPEMFTLATSGATTKELTDKLFHRATETIGVTDTQERNQEIAELILIETNIWRQYASS